QPLRLRRGFPLRCRTQLRHFLLQPRQLMFRFAKLSIRFCFCRRSLCNRCVDVLRVLEKKGRLELQKNPCNQARHDREINPLEDLIRALSRSVAAFFRGVRAHRRKKQNQKRAAKTLPCAAPRHRASRAGPPGRGAPCSTRRAISAAHCPTEALSSCSAPANSLATRSLPAATSVAALLRACFNSAARSSSSFFRAASCSVYTCARAFFSAS